MSRYAFITVTDGYFFPGTLATVNSVLEYHPDADVFVVANHRHPLTRAQSQCLEACKRLQVIDSRRLAKSGRHINAWELKAYACHDLCADYEVMVGIDSDCLLCSNVSDVIDRCRDAGGFIGGRDGDGETYDESYRVYGIRPPARNPRYMSTSLYFCAVTRRNRAVLRRWAECCSAARFNGTGPHPGHGDQGVLNAVLFARRCTAAIELLDNRLWSQHWTYWDSVIEFRDGAFINNSAGGLRQRSFHCPGTDKFWSRAHRDRACGANSLPSLPYLWFLAMLGFGRLARPKLGRRWLPSGSRHVIDDLSEFLPLVAKVHPAALERRKARRRRACDV
jgi:hypothetical protein